MLPNNWSISPITVFERAPFYQTIRSKPNSYQNFSTINIIDQLKNIKIILKKYFLTKQKYSFEGRCKIFNYQEWSTTANIYSLQKSNDYNQVLNTLTKFCQLQLDLQSLLASFLISTLRQFKNSNLICCYQCSRYMTVSNFYE